MDRHVDPVLETVAAYRDRARRERTSQPNWRLRRALAGVGKPLLAAYWLVCLGVLAAGANALYPQAGARLAEVVLRAAPPSADDGAFEDQDETEAAADLSPAPALRGLAGFPNCEAAHRAGVYDIPVGSGAYDPRQDGDRDGFACETYPGDPYVGRRLAGG